MLRLVALLLPLSLDTFAVAAALGATGIARSKGLRVSLVFVGFTDVYIRLCSMGVIHDLRII